MTRTSWQASVDGFYQMIAIAAFGSTIKTDADVIFDNPKKAGDGHSPRDGKCQRPPEPTAQLLPRPVTEEPWYG
jgi:hypothetical protein